jgi:hypothetical protein
VSELSQGRILWAIVADQHGHSKHRPVVILDRTVEISTAKPLTCVVASHSAALKQPRRDSWIELPWSESADTETKLRKPTVAVCEWLAAVDASRITENDVGGIVPQSIMLEIIQKVTRIQLAKGMPPQALPPM